MTTAQPFLAKAPLTKVVRVSNTTLYHLAAYHYNDARMWTYIAQANDLIDPWIFGISEIIIPNVGQSNGTPSGILGQ